MGFVLITPCDRAIVIDGGRPEEMPNLARHVGNRPIAAWILTHPHMDHISGINHLLRVASPLISATEAFYCHFPTPESLRGVGVPEKEVQPVSDFLRYSGAISDRLHTPVTGDVLEIDGLRIEFLFHWDGTFTHNPINDSSLAFRVTGAEKSVLFLADLGPEAGEKLLRTQKSRLHADVVQMAYHGHMCVHKDVYEEIAPAACIWCCASWLYNEPDKKIASDLYGVGTTRRWMRELGVTTHYVTKDGDQVLSI